MPASGSTGRRVEAAIAALDCLAWAVAISTTQLLRNDFDLFGVGWWPSTLLAGWTMLLQVAIGWRSGLYRRRYRFGSLEETLALAGATALVGAAVLLPVILLGPGFGVPRSVPPLAWPIALVAMWAVRVGVRKAELARVRPQAAARAVVYGAGSLGAELVRGMLNTPDSPYLPVALVDDDPRKHRAQLGRLRVQGTLAELTEVAAACDASVLVVAIGTADAALLRRALDAATAAGLTLKVVPPLAQLIAGPHRVTDLRDVSIEDIIGRQPVDTDVEQVAGFLTGKRVLVTGAGGSIGLELCRQIHRFAPAELIMLDRDETGLQAAEVSVFSHGLLDGPEVVLADIRDAATLRSLFAQRRPEVVFHAAALQHLPMLQQYPEEAWKTNVVGTLNVLQAARSVGVEVFINISTDKAANPASVLGHSKRLAERLTAWQGAQTGARYLSVRFGNVLGSRGSMLPLFTTMISAGGPLTVTHPDVTRYFMTIPEACQLVVQAGGIGRPGEVLILDMGEPVRILDIAQRMIGMSGRDDVRIVFTGLRPGEKLHEELLASGERDARPVHRKISHAQVPALAPTELDWARWSKVWLAEPIASVPRIAFASVSKEQPEALPDEQFAVA